jgi:tRNA threonylcarbamoyladenosine biosynthesis protein TsaE
VKRSGSRARTAEAVYSLSEDETLELGRRFARDLCGGELVILEGELGAGKTVFARGIAAGLDVPADEVRSPTFGLIHEHAGGRLRLYHIDLYRLEGLAEIETLGLEELVGKDAIVVVEWGERLPEYYRQHAVRVRIRDLGEGSRRIEVSELAPTGGAGTGADQSRR